MIRGFFLVFVALLTLGTVAVIDVTNLVERHLHHDWNSRWANSSFGVLDEVWSILESESIFNSQVEAQDIETQAIREILNARGDPYAEYFTQEQYRFLADELRGKFFGIGAEMSSQDGLLIIVEVIEGSPAEKAGLDSGDLVLAIEGVDVRGMEFEDAIRAIRGPLGSTVSLLVRNLDDIDSRQVVIIRDEIAVNSVELEYVDGNVAVLRIKGFHEDTIDEVEQALNHLESHLASGLILDLRNNPGGLLASAVAVADLFLDEVLITYEIDAKGTRSEWWGEVGGKALEIPMIVLVNASSASASEVVAGALSANNRAVIVGTNTFGKGSVNLLIELSGENGAFSFTSARWFTPDGNLIEGIGIEPDILLVQDMHIPLGEEEDEQLILAAQQFALK